ncbi:MAG: hypothetical protein PUE03_04435 [Prevotella sp.]|nr:hypothetical protein [Prevotella sp.]
MKISVTLHKAPKKGEDQNLRQVIFRVREGNNDLKVRTDLMADPTIWDDSIPGYRRTTKLGKGGTKCSVLNKLTLLTYQYETKQGHG